MLSLLTFDRPFWCVSLSFLCKQIEANCVFVNADLVKAHFTATKSEIFIISLSKTRTNLYLMSNPPEMRKIQQINSAVSRPLVVYRSGNINDTLQLRSRPRFIVKLAWLPAAKATRTPDCFILISPWAHGTAKHYGENVRHHRFWELCNHKRCQPSRKAARLKTGDGTMFW